jgi:hypothetical protein
MAATLEAIIAALALLKEVFAALHKDQADKFLAEWEKDEQAILKALEAGDAAALNAFRAKYLRPLL